MTGKADLPRRRKATGPDRPSYFDANDTDRVIFILLALVSEVAAIRERLDTHERLGDAGSLAAHAEVEKYTAPDAVEDDRNAWRDAYIRRLFRVITEDIEALGETSENTPGAAD